MPSLLFITCISLSFLILDTKPQSSDNLSIRSASKCRLQSEQVHGFNFPLIIFLSISHNDHKASLNFAYVWRNNNNNINIINNFTVLCQSQYIRSYYHVSLCWRFWILFFSHCIHLIKLEWIHMKWAILKIIFRVNHTAHQWLGTTANLIIESKLANGVDVDVLCPNLSLDLQIIAFFPEYDENDHTLHVPDLLVHSQAAWESFLTLLNLVKLQVYTQIKNKELLTDTCMSFLGLMLGSPRFWKFWHSSLWIHSNSVRCFSIFMWKSESHRMTLPI